MVNEEKEINEIKLKHKGLMIRDHDVYDSYKKRERLEVIIFLIVLTLVIIGSAIVFVVAGYTEGYQAGLMNTEPCQAIINASKGLM